MKTTDQSEKPTTGEWTEDTVMMMFLSQDGGQGRASEAYKAIAEAHNAALRNAQPFLDEALKQLAAERFQKDALQTAYDKCDAALAAEREQYQRSQEKVKEYFALLAAERECTCDIDTICRVHGCPHCYELEKQLAAEREQLSAVTTALTKTDTALVAERERSQDLDDKLTAECGYRDRLREELDAAVAALKRLRDGKPATYAGEYRDIIDAALAKIGEKK